MGNLTPATRINLATGLPVNAIGCGTPVKVKCVWHGLADVRLSGVVGGNPIITIEGAITENPVDDDFCPVTECSNVVLDNSVIQIRLNCIDRLWYRACITDSGGATSGTVDVNVLLKPYHG